MEFWVLTILALISVIYCCDLPLIIDMPLFVNNHNALFYGIGQSIIAAYIFYVVQVVLVDKVKLRKCKDAAYIEIDEIEKRMNNVIVLLSGKKTYENFSSYPEKETKKYLDSIDIFQTGAKQDKCMREMTIMEALMDDLEIIDEHIRNLLVYNLIDEKKKNLFRDITHALIKRIVESLKENEPGTIENVRDIEESRSETTTSVRTINFDAYKKDIVTGLKSYDELLTKLRKIKRKDVLIK